MQGPLAAMERSWSAACRLGPGWAQTARARGRPLREAGRCAWGGFVRGGMHRWISSVHLSLCDGDSVQKRTRVAGHSGPPGGPDHPPRPLTQKRKMVHPPTFPVSLLLLKWMLSFSPSP